MAKKVPGLIDLGKSVDYGVAAKPVEASKPSVVYPTLYIRDVDGLDDLPDGNFNFLASGRVVMREERTRDGNETCSYEIEIYSIKPDKTMDGAKPSEVSLAEALDEMETDDNAEEEDSE